MPNWCENTIRFTDCDGFERAAKLLRANGGEPRLSSIVSTPRSAYIVPGPELFLAVRLYRELYATEAERAAIDAYDTWSFRLAAKYGTTDAWEGMLSDTLDCLRAAGADASAPAARRQSSVSESMPSQASVVPYFAAKRKLQVS